MTRRSLLFATLSLSLLSLPTLPASAQNDGDPLADTVAQGKGRINYSTGVVKATGYGAPPGKSQNPAQARLMAMGAARADALRNLAMTVSSIQVTATTKVKNYITESDTIETKVTAVLQNARIVSETIGKDGMASVVMEIPLYGPSSVASAVLAEAILEPRTATPIAPPVAAAPRVATPAVREPAAIVKSGPKAPVEPAPRPVRVVEPEPLPERPLKSKTALAFKEPRGGAKPIRVEPRKPKPEPKNYHLPITSPIEEGPFTSVIVDCRGLGIQAVMSPKIYDTSGHEIYGTLHVDIDYAIETGIVGYPRSVEEALTGKRAGEKPFVVRAVRPRDQYKMDVVVSDEDGRRILEKNRIDGFLEKCRVILLCDPVR
jgi:hypothetical protein